MQSFPALIYSAFYALLRLIFWPILAVFFQFEVRGLAHLKSCKRGVIVAGNHTGYLDSFLLVAAVPRLFHFLTREEVLSWRFVGAWVKRANTIVLYPARLKSILRDVSNRLKQGEAICIFPEGQLTRNGQLGEFQKGVAFLQKSAQVPIVPFAIQGGFEAWAEGRPWPTFRKIRLAFGAPIQPDAYDSDTLSDALRERVASLKLMLDLEDAAVRDIRLATCFSGVIHSVGALES